MVSARPSRDEQRDEEERKAPREERRRRRAQARRSPARRALGVHRVQGLELLSRNHVLGHDLFPSRWASRAKFASEAGAVGYRCRERCFANDLIMRHVGDRMIISPALVIAATLVGNRFKTI